MTAEQIRQGVWMIVILGVFFLVMGYLLCTEFGHAPSAKTAIIWMIAFMSLAFPIGYLAQEHDELRHRRR